MFTPNGTKCLVKPDAASSVMFGASDPSQQPANDLACAVVWDEERKRLVTFCEHYKPSLVLYLPNQSIDVSCDSIREEFATRTGTETGRFGERMTDECNKTQKASAFAPYHQK